jgi:hypothetical protein
VPRFTCNLGGVTNEQKRQACEDHVLEELPRKGARDDIISLLKPPKLPQSITDWPRSETDSLAG